MSDIADKSVKQPDVYKTTFSVQRINGKVYLSIVDRTKPEPKRGIYEIDALSLQGLLWAGPMVRAFLEDGEA